MCGRTNTSWLQRGAHAILCAILNNKRVLSITKVAALQAEEPPDTLCERRPWSPRVSSGLLEKLS